jgi:hypothetical protein
MANGELNAQSIFTKAVWGIIGAVGLAILTWAGNFFTNGGIIRALGGFSTSQLAEAVERQSVANCGDYRNELLGDPKKTFCFLSDISIRKGNANGWAICKLEIGSPGDSNAGMLLLTAQMQPHETCTGDAQISCKAKCIHY